MVKPARYSARCCSRCSGVISRSALSGEHERVAAHVVQRPHLLVVEAQMRLRDQGLAVGADEVQILDRVGQIPAVVERLPLALAAEAAHRGRRAALVLVGEGHRRGPAVELVGEGVQLAVDLVDHHVLADQAGHQAAPAAVRVDVADVLLKSDDRLARVAELGVPLPEVAELGVPARILVLEPLEVLVGLGLDPPEVDRPADREELRDLVDVVLLGDAIPGRLRRRRGGS